METEEERETKRRSGFDNQIVKKHNKSRLENFTRFVMFLPLCIFVITMFAIKITKSFYYIKYKVKYIYNINLKKEVCYIFLNERL